MAQSPLDDIRKLIAELPGPDEQARAAAAAAIVEPGELGRLDEIAVWLSAWSGKPKVEIRRPIVSLFAGAPGPGRLDAAQAIRERLEAVAAGTAAVSRLAATAGAGLEAFDLAIDRPIGDIETAPALGERECAATMAFGMEVLSKQPDLLVLSDLGGAGASSPAALALALFGGEPGDWAGDDARHVGAAAERATAEGGDGLDILRQLGGREIAAMAGAILAARNQKVPVILDGFGACAAAAAMRTVRRDSIDHCIVAQCPPVPGQARLVEQLGEKPLIALSFHRAEGTGGVAALSMVKLAAAATA